MATHAWCDSGNLHGHRRGLRRQRRRAVRLTIADRGPQRGADRRRRTRPVRLSVRADHPDRPASPIPAGATRTRPRGTGANATRRNRPWCAKKHQPPAGHRRRSSPRTPTTTAAPTLATCTVVDDDGGVGADTTVVRVVHLHNGEFEDGFHRGESRRSRPTTGASSKASDPDAAAGARFSAEQFIVHGGQRSQRDLGLRSRFDGGLVPARRRQPGLGVPGDGLVPRRQRRAARCRLGLDAAGGADPGAQRSPGPRRGESHGDWVQLCTRVTATADAVTHLLVTAATRRTRLWFDDVVLVADAVLRRARRARTPPRRPHAAMPASMGRRREPQPRAAEVRAGRLRRRRPPGRTRCRSSRSVRPPAPASCSIPPGGLTSCCRSPHRQVTADVVAPPAWRSPLLPEPWWSTGRLCQDHRTATVSMRGTGDHRRRPSKAATIGCCVELPRDVIRNRTTTPTTTPTTRPETATGTTPRRTQWQTTPSASKPGRKTRLPRK